MAGLAFSRGADWVNDDEFDSAEERRARRARMAKVNLDSGSFTPTPPPEVPQDPVEKILTAWYKELEEMRFVSSAQYEVEGLRTVFEEQAYLQAMAARVDSLMSKGHRLHRKLLSALKAVQDLLDDEMDKLRSHPERLIGKAFAYQEREACYRSAPELIESRRRIRVLERQVSDCETFVKVVTHKNWHLEGLRKDQQVQTTLIRLGYSLREFEVPPAGETRA
jgi:uncharacterized UPF0160 family protein